MRWSNPVRVDIRGVIDRHQLYYRQININRAKMRGAGTPATYYRNTAITFYGTPPKDAIKCYCWGEGTDKEQPNRSHPLCMGTGYLSGYQKYGYEELVISTPSNVTKSTNVVISDKNKFIISGSVTSIQETITTEVFQLSNFYGVDRLLVADAIEPDQNRVDYYYSVDGSPWVQLTFETYSSTRLGNKQATNFSLYANPKTIQFRIILRKRVASAQSPRFNSLRFRYRNQLSLLEIDSIHKIEIPAFLTSREQGPIVVEQGEFGWKTTQPFQWWVLPEAHIENGDIITFLKGEFKDQKYEVQELTPYTHGPEMIVTHRQFKANFVRDNKDIVPAIEFLE